MKKHIIAVLISLMVLNILAYAGSIPEDAVYDDNAQVFFAKLISYRPNGEGDTEVNLIPTKIIKGDVVSGISVWYDEPSQVGDFPAAMGEEYLFLYFDENNPTYFFKTTSQDTKTLKFENVTGDMWDRLEQYFNEGKFEAAEQERQQKNIQVNTQADEKQIPPKDNKIPYYTAIGAALALVLGGIGLKGKCKNGKDGNQKTE